LREKEVLPTQEYTFSKEYFMYLHISVGAFQYSLLWTNWKLALEGTLIASSALECMYVRQRKAIAECIFVATLIDRNPLESWLHVMKTVNKVVEHIMQLYGHFRIHKPDSRKLLLKMRSYVVGLPKFTFSSHCAWCPVPTEEYIFGFAYFLYIKWNDRIN
jgi:hypothetical protein